MFNSPFKKNESKSKIESIQQSDIIFVSDLFAEEYTGGAELTTQALIGNEDNREELHGYKICKVRSEELTMELLAAGVDKYWIFTNFSGMNSDLIPSIIANIKYSIIEYDFKYCTFRSIEKHKAATNKECDCHNQPLGKMISAFFYGSNSIFWMSEKQKNLYEKVFPFLSRKKSIILTSMFSKDFFEFVAENSENEKSDSYIIVGSDSWIKGVEDSVEYCEKNNLDYEVVSGISHKKLLLKMSKSKGLVFLPRGGDTCPRTVIEAKLLGCDLVINDNVMHKDEDWFNTDDLKKTISWLVAGPSRFWSEIYGEINRQPTISGYTTTLNCIDQSYPFEESILSMLGFCDQVVVVDGGSTDGTIEALNKIADKNKNLIIHVQERDWDSKRFAVFDGLQKALARAMCTSEWCWQQDSDEVIHENDYHRVKALARNLPKSMDLIALPLVEFWGGPYKIRMDINPWKWRMSRNRPHITHGIPKDLRCFDNDGELYSKPGSDGCDYVRSDTYEPVPFVNFYTKDADDIRNSALNGNIDAIYDYNNWFMSVVQSLPSVWHYSWFDIERKIKTYRDYWSSHWQSLYDITQEDTAENNMFFDKAWTEVSDDEIKSLAKDLAEKSGGHIFHSKVDLTKPVVCIALEEGTPEQGMDRHPKIMRKWMKRKVIKEWTPGDKK